MNSTDRLRLQSLAKSFIRVMKNSGEVRDKLNFPSYKIFQHASPSFDIVGFPIQGESYFLTRNAMRALLSYIGPSAKIGDASLTKVSLPLSATNGRSSNEFMSYALTVLFEFHGKKLQVSISQTGLLHITEASVLYTRAAKQKYAK